MRLVVDTNLLISGVLWEGAPARLLDAVESGRASLVLTEELLQEFSQVIARPKFAERLARCHVSPRMLVGRLLREAELVTAPAISAPLGLRDPNDLLVLAAAVGGRVNAIVTGDNDLLELNQIAGIPIVRVEVVLTRLGGG